MDSNLIINPMNLPEKMHDKIKSLFPKSLKYNFDWMCRNEMGPNPIWLAEFLTREILIKPGSRILDLGCGKALSSIFLATEYKSQVWAADLWIQPTENYQRVKAQNPEPQIFPIYAEAHSLPFAEAYFDFIFSIDAYHYFGTDENYLLYISRFLKPGGILGIVAPGFQKEMNTIPEELRACWSPEFFTFHTAEWWKNHWQKTELLKVLTADVLPDSWGIWLYWEKYLLEHNLVNPEKGSDLNLLEADQGCNLCLVRLIAQKS